MLAGGLPQIHNARVDQPFASAAPNPIALPRPLLIWLAIFFMPALLGCPAFLACAQGTESPKPLLRAHAHNDYEHARPLLDALDQGFCSAEADIWLSGGELLVAHNRNQLSPERSLRRLYLDPLRERARQNGGRVVRGGPEFSLLIDLKSDWKLAYPALRAVLADYSEMLTTFAEGKVTRRAVLVVISGSRSLGMFDGETNRLAAYDGELSALDANPPANLVPWVSANWKASFKWRAAGPLPPEEKTRLDGIVARAHQQGRKVRFWGAPDMPIFWREMLVSGVDLINTDKLAELRAFLLGEEAVR